MAKRSSKATESCLEKAPCFNLMSDDDFEELQAGNQLQTMQWNTDWSQKVYRTWEEERNAAQEEKVPSDLLEGKNLKDMWQNGSGRGRMAFVEHYSSTNAHSLS